MVHIVDDVELPDLPHVLIFEKLSGNTDHPLVASLIARGDLLELVLLEPFEEIDGPELRSLGLDIFLWVKDMLGNFIVEVVKDGVGPAVTVEIECIVDKGSVGFALWLERDDRFISREIIMEARTGSQRLCLSTDAYEPDGRLLTRSATALGASEYRISSIEMRQAL